MSLAQQLDDLRESLGKQFPADVKATMQEATDQLRGSGIMERIIKVGDQLPDFSLKNVAGDLVTSNSLLAQGAVVLTVFRGAW